MPKRTDIHKILIIGSGPIVIGQACEFDYSGTQACKALRQEGYRVVLVNSNPATIMTDPETADSTYIEPLTVEAVSAIIRKERPDALLPTVGGQTALNLAIALDDSGILEECGVEMIGAKREAIRVAEDRMLFKKAMDEAGLQMPRGGFAKSWTEAEEVVADTGYPAMIRPTFTLGGTSNISSGNTIRIAEEGEAVEGFSETEIVRLKTEAPDEGLAGVSPRFVINAISNAITRGNARSLTSMELLLALKDAIDSDARIDAKQKKQWFDHLVTARKEFYNRWVKEDVHRALFASFEDEGQQLLEKYLDEIEASLDQRQVTDPMTGENRAPDERFLRSVEEKIKVSESGKQSFRQEVVRKAMVAFKAGEKFRLGSHARVREAIEQYLFEERRDVLRLVTSTNRPDDEARQKISVVQERLVKEYGYDEHSAQEALNYVTTLLSQE